MLELTTYYVTIADSMQGTPQGRWSGDHATLAEAQASASHARAMGWAATVRGEETGEAVGRMAFRPSPSELLERGES